MVVVKEGPPVRRVVVETSISSERSDTSFTHGQQPIVTVENPQDGSISQFPSTTIFRPGERITVTPVTEFEGKGSITRFRLEAETRPRRVKNTR